MRTTFVETLKELARQDERIFLHSADMGYSVFETFREEFPDRFLNTGIAEQNTIGIAAGLAARGKIVFVYSIIPFVTMRCFEQIRLDLAYNKSNVKIVGVGAGFTYGSLGSSHHALEDISIMRSLPNMTVLCPGDPVEARELIKQSCEHTGPVYIPGTEHGNTKRTQSEIIHHQGHVQHRRVYSFGLGSRTSTLLGHARTPLPSSWLCKDRSSGNQ